MSLYRLKSAPSLLIQDNINVNVVPLLLELLHEQNSLKVLCLEQPDFTWRCALRSCGIVTCYENPADICNVQEKSTVLIDSVNQLALRIGWSNCLNLIKNMQRNPLISQLVLILHKDCISYLSRISIHLCHLTSAIVSYSNTDPSKVYIHIKKSGKLLKSEETLSCDIRTNTMKCTPIVKENKKDDEVERPQPESLTTFKIEVDQTEKLEKYKLKLPYMNKIGEGQGKVYYEPDAVDDWDEEDPDDDLDI